MMHTTQGAMTPMDFADHQALTDTGPHPDCPGHFTDNGLYVRSICSVADDCPGEVQAMDFNGTPDAPLTGLPMDAFARLDNYLRQRRGGRLTSRQRKRLAKKAGRDDNYMVIRDLGMGYPASRQGQRRLDILPLPVSGAPV